MEFVHNETFCYSCGRAFPAPTLQDIVGQEQGKFMYSVMCLPECNRHTGGTGQLTPLEIGQLYVMQLEAKRYRESERQKKLDKHPCKVH